MAEKETCSEAKRVVAGIRRHQLVVTTHQKTDCRYCKIDASHYNHCAYCGATFRNLKELADHLPDLV